MTKLKIGKIVCFLPILGVVWCNDLDVLERLGQLEKQNDFFSQKIDFLEEKSAFLEAKVEFLEAENRQLRDDFEEINEEFEKLQVKINNFVEILWKKMRSF